MEIFGLTSGRPPLRTYAATTPEAVRPLLARAEQAATGGRWVTLLVAYVAAPAFDPAMRVHPRTSAPSHARSSPLAWAAEVESLEP
ncbi:MAG: hypothetical protein AB7P99_03635, partial [Vicinamibacterales bacterium]